MSERLQEFVINRMWLQLAVADLHSKFMRWHVNFILYEPLEKYKLNWMVCVMCEWSLKYEVSGCFRAVCFAMLHPCSEKMVWSALWLGSFFLLSLIALEDIVGKMSKESFIVRETETGWGGWGWQMREDWEWREIKREKEYKCNQTEQKFNGWNDTDKGTLSFLEKF